MSASGVQSGGQTYTGVTVNQTGPDLPAPTASAVKLLIVTTAIGTGSITVTIQGKDKFSGQYYTLLASAAIVTNTNTLLTVFPGAPVSANVSANDILPEIWRWTVTANNANAATYTIGFSTAEF